MSPTVNILVSIPDPKFFDSCTLCFDTLRVGFPTANVVVTLNPVGKHVQLMEAAEKAKKLAGATINWKGDLVHHADWIRSRIRQHDPANGPLVILDADTIFWKYCEDWTFNHPLAGFYVPEMWNDFAQCRSVARLHTSLLWINDTGDLLDRIQRAYPNSSALNGEYCPCDPFMPAVRFQEGKPTFYDTCANLYNMIGGDWFTPDKLECFDHLNSASFQEVMQARLEPEESAGMKAVHTDLVKTPEKLRNLWPLVQAYYLRKSLQLGVQRPEIS